MADEFDLIAWIRERASGPLGRSPCFRRGRDRHVMIDIGDDACALLFGGETIVATTDIVIEGVHFKLDEAGCGGGKRDAGAGVEGKLEGDISAKVQGDSPLFARASPREVGWKSMAVNLSDVAAMGCEPMYALASVVFRKDDTMEFAQEVFEGIFEAMREFDVALVGGNVATVPGNMGLSICGTVLGRAKGRPPVTRSGAQVGDAIMVTGALGGSILGKHLRFQPRVREGLWLNENYELHAMIDISDGLTADLGHVLDASGVGAVLFEEKIPVSDDAVKLSKVSGRTPLEHALSDGEDYELLFTLNELCAMALEAASPFGTSVVRIGTIIGEKVLRLKRRGGEEVDLSREGYRHTFK